jgi:hypothetical protein
MADYRPGPGHLADVEAALVEFHKALTKRWREEVAEKILDLSYAFPSSVNRSANPTEPPLWPYYSTEARHHFVSGPCSYMEWATGGQDSSLSSVSCEGKTGVDQDTEVMEINGNGMVILPPRIDCGMGTVFEQVEDWAWGERDFVFYAVPQFDNQDLARLEEAHREVLDAGKTLKLEKDSGSDESIGSFEPASDRDLSIAIGKVDDLQGGMKDWLTSWTGLSADRYKGGFASSVNPTAYNQSMIIGGIANCMAERAAIIEKGRNDSLYWIDWATGSFGERTTETQSLVKGWKVIQGIGTATTSLGAWNPPVAASGAAIILFGYIGENMFPEVRTEGYKHSIKDVLTEIRTHLKDLKNTIEELESYYNNDVIGLQGFVNDIHSFNLELYDLTENNAAGDNSEQDGQFSANPTDILNLAKNCYEAAEYYEPLVSKLTSTSDADADLSGKDGEATYADKELIEIRDQLIEFLKTTCARYITAGEQIEAAAQSYDETDSDQESAFDRAWDDWNSGDHSAPETDWDPGKEAEATDRGTDERYDDHPALGGTNPGDGDEVGYTTELGDA